MVAVDVSPTAEHASAAAGDAPRRSAGAFLARHWAIAVLLVLGAGIRAAATYAYWPAFWFQADSGIYLGGLSKLQPGSFGSNNVGYPAFLWLFSGTGSLGLVAIAQHVLSVGLAVAIYAFLRRRDVAPWLAALGTAPILLDARQIVVEHYILSDSLFTVLVTAAVILVMRNAKPGYTACVVAAVLIVAAILTRSVGVPVAGVFVVYLALRRVGWLRLIAFVATIGVLMFGYLTWAQQVTGKFGLSTMQGRYLYSRVAGIADCAKLDLTAEQRYLCPSQPLDQRPERGDWYLWNDPKIWDLGKDKDDLLGGFAKAVIVQQPVDFGLLVADQTGRFLVPGFTNGPAVNCLFQWWEFPEDYRDNTVPGIGRCKPMVASTVDFSAAPATDFVDEHTTARKALAWYSDWITVPRTALGLVVLLGLFGLCWRPRRRWRDNLDAAALVVMSVALLVMAAATSMYEIRYALTPMVLLGMGAALAVNRLRSTTDKPDPDPVAENQ